MKRLWVIPVLALILSFCAVAVVQAHPPMKLTMSYADSQGLLKIGLEHPVGDRSDHFIEKVTVMIEGREAAILFYTEQMTQQGQSILVTVGNLAEGTKVTVKAVCNKFGELEKTGLVQESSDEGFIEIQ